MCTLGAAIGGAQSFMASTAQNSAYQDGVDRYYDNKERVGRSSIIKYNKLGIKASQEELVRSQKKEQLQSATNKAVARAVNTGSNAGIVAGRAATINQANVMIESYNVKGRIEQESKHALNAFGLNAQDIYMTGEYQIASAHPGSPPSGAGQFLSLLMGIGQGYLMTKGSGGSGGSSTA
tara:strand:- start:16538 stop:17074 length:537 start_codon:yes stop_codon:yes gene_type:complete